MAWISSFYKIKAISMFKSEVKTLSCVAEKTRSCTARPEMRFTWRAPAGAQSQNMETRCPEKLNIAKMPLKIHNATPSLSEICGYTSEKRDRRFLKSGLGPLGDLSDKSPSHPNTPLQAKWVQFPELLSLCIHTHLPSVPYLYYSFLHQPNMKMV